MNADASAATHDYSSRPEAETDVQSPRRRPSPSTLALRLALAACAAAGALLLVVSTFTDIVEIRVLTVSDVPGQDTHISGWDLHGVALVLVALFAAVMLVGVLRGSRPAAAALAAAGASAVGLIVAVDVPELDDTGQLAQFYEDVTARAATGFYLETLGAVLVLVAGGGLWLLGGTRPRNDTSRSGGTRSGS